MKKFEDFEKEYIVFFPSGEILYISDFDVKKLLLSNNIKKPEHNKYLVAMDSMKKRIVDIINGGDDLRDKIKTFLLHVGVLKDQFQINDDLSIDVFGSISIRMMSLRRIPYKFNRCTGDFDCSFNNLISLVNSPTYVGGKFDCSHNNLVNLKGGPKFTTTYLCNNNKLTSLFGSPEIVKYFNCSYNQIDNYTFAPDLSPGGKIISKNNPVEK